MAVIDCDFGLLEAVEDMVCDEMKQPAAARESQLESGSAFFGGLAIGFEGAATNGKIGPRGKFRSGGEFGGVECHKHDVSVLQPV